jgi:hypothetical protein
MAKQMTDEERYGKVGAEIRRLDPEAYKKRPKSMEGNLKLLKELREKSKATPARQLTADEFMEAPGSRGVRFSEAAKPFTKGPQGPRRYPGQRQAGQAERASAAMERNRSALPSDRSTSFRSQAEETGMTADERAAKARDYAKNIAMTAGVGRVGAAAGAPYARTVEGFRRTGDKAAEMRGKILARKDIPSFSERYRAREAAEKARETSPRRLRERAEQMLDEKLAADMAGGFRKGGRVKKYAGGGSVKSSASRRADGIAQRGKTRGKMI